jgi:hypothetical protein
VKIKDFFVEKVDNCTLCDIHLQAEKAIDNNVALECPKCHTKVEEEHLLTGEIIVVGETNTCDLEENITKNYVFRCGNCSEKIRVKLEAIIWNANHDVYYNGGKKYLVDYDEKIKISAQFKKLAIPLIENYTERIKNGENLQPVNLYYWLDNIVEELVAERVNNRL